MQKGQLANNNANIKTIAQLHKHTKLNTSSVIQNQTYANINMENPQIQVGDHHIFECL